MASYAPNFTKRLKLSYSTLGANYVQTWRVNAASSVEDLPEGLFNFYTAIAPLIPNDFTIEAAETAPAAVDFFLPTSTGSLAPFTGTGVGAVGNLSEFRCNALQFVGKTLTGNPWRVSVFGALVAPFNTLGSSLSDDFRISADDSSDIADAVLALEECVSLYGLCGNDGNPVIIRPYANIVISRYRINRIRRFG